MTKKQKDTLVRELKNGMRVYEVAALLRLTVAEVRAAEKADKEFARETKRAPMVFKRYLVRIVAQGGKEWQAAAMILERRWPREWANAN